MLFHSLHAWSLKLGTQLDAIALYMSLSVKYIFLLYRHINCQVAQEKHLGTLQEYLCN